jgi:hypothetical protein
MTPFDGATDRHESIVLKDDNGAMSIKINAASTIVKDEDGSEHRVFYFRERELETFVSSLGLALVKNCVQPILENFQTSIDNYEAAMSKDQTEMAERVLNELAANIYEQVASNFGAKVTKRFVERDPSGYITQIVEVEPR